MLHATLGMIPAEKYHLFAYVTLTILALALLGVLNDALVAKATSIEAIGIATVDSVQERVDASLHGLLPL